MSLSGDRHARILVAGTLLVAGCAGPGTGESPAETARRIHAEGAVFDGHNDLPWQYRQRANGDLDAIDVSVRQPDLHTDLPRLAAGGVGAQFWSVYVPAETAQTGDALHGTLEQIDLVRRLVDRHPETLEAALTADDVERIVARGRIACLMGVEGGHSIEDSLACLRMLYDLGVRYLTLTHSDTLDWADSATDEARNGGLSPFGVEVVHEMNRLGMLVDLSHVSVETMYDALRVSRAPVIWSHSSARALADHVRNVPDDVLELVPGNGGVVMINFFSGFVVPESARTMADMFDVLRLLREAHPEDDEAFERELAAWRAAHPMEAGTVADVVDHIEHVARVAGVDHVGLGSDFDGVTLLPEGLEDASCYPAITEELLRRGWSEADVRKVLGGNALRVLRAAERVARGEER